MLECHVNGSVSLGELWEDADGHMIHKLSHRI